MRYNNTLLYLSCIIGTCLILNACSFKNRQAILKTPFDTDTIRTVKVINELPTNNQYYNLIQPEDELAIKDMQDLSLITRIAGEGATMQQQNYMLFRVNADGNVLLPKIGSIKVAGLNRIQAAAAIQNAYAEKELKAPLIDVRIANASVVLFGEVGKQGKYLLEREDYQLIDLLADAGGVTPNANRKMVRIFRGDRNNPQIILVNLNDYNFIKNPHLKLQARDIIYIEPRRVVSNSQDLQAYSSFIQVGLVLLNTLLIIYNIAK